jgi:hypothetical protein
MTRILTVAMVGCVAAFSRIDAIKENAVIRADTSSVGQIVSAVLRAVPVDSLCQPERCPVVVVDTAIRGAPKTGDLDVNTLPVVGFIPASALQSLAKPGVRFVAGSFRYGPLPHDSARVALVLSPPTLASLGRGSVSLTIVVPVQYGFVAVVQIQRQDGTWRAVSTRYTEA